LRLHAALRRSKGLGQKIACDYCLEKYIGCSYLFGMQINCEILDIRIFLAILDFGGFQRAAEALNLSQPTLTRRIQALEESFGTKLFDRTTRQVAPTRVGREVETHFRRMAREFEDCVFGLTDYGIRPSGVLTIACLPTMASAFLPNVLRLFNLRYPDIRFRIRDTTASEGLDCVSRGEAEFGINSLGASRQDLVFTPFMDDSFALACRADHAVARSQSLRWEDIKDLPLIISLRSDNRMLIDQALARSGLSLNWSYQVSHLATSFGLVEEGLGMSVVPLMSRPRTLHPTIRIIPLTEPSVSRTIGFVEARNRELSRAAEELKRLIIDVAKKTSDSG
jgi:DNA-binding transcriptional LysR family regulator